MNAKKNIKIKLAILIVAILCVIIAQFAILPTLSRFRKVTSDEVRAYYTALYIDQDASGKVIAVEEQPDGSYEGDFSINISNFIGEDVTERDIEYKIYQKEILGPSNGEYYVLGTWNEHVPVETATLGYEINIKNEGVTEMTAATHILPILYNSGEVPQGVTNSHIIHIKRPSATIKPWASSDEIERISIVIEINEPYRDVVVIDLLVSTKLIVYSTQKINKFGFEAERLYVQTASSWKEINYDNNIGFKTDAFKVIIKWDNYRIDNSFEKIFKHVPEGTGNFDSRYIDQVYYEFDDATGNNVTNNNYLILYVPANSDFYIDFYKFDSSGTKSIMAYNALMLQSTGAYAAYDETYNGYPHNKTSSSVNGITNYYEIYTE